MCIFIFNIKMAAQKFYFANLKKMHVDMIVTIQSNKVVLNEVKDN